MSEQQQASPSHANLILKHIDRIPALSPTVSKIIQVANNPASTANDLNKVISLDPVLTAKILRLVNSAYFGFSEGITSTVRAIIILGLNTIKNLALSTAALATLTRAKSAGAGLDMMEFWKHSLACGVAAKLVARKMNVERNNLEDYFIAGLLHDIGKIVFNHYSPLGYLKISQNAKEKSIPLSEEEKNMLGMTHMEIGSILAEKWRLNKALTNTITFHHNVRDCDAEDMKLVSTIALVNTICKSQNIGFSGNSFIEDIDDEIWMTIGLIEKDLLDINEYLPEGVEKALVFLQV